MELSRRKTFIPIKFLTKAKFNQVFANQTLNRQNVKNDLAETTATDPTFSVSSKKTSIEHLK